MTTALLARPADPLRQLTDDELAAAYHAGTDAARAAVTRECDRRDAAGRRAAAIRARQEEWLDAAHAAYIQADTECKGKLLSPLGERNVSDPLSLWRGSEADAMRWASEELREWWHVNGRVTPGQFARERGAARRAEYELHLAETAAVIAARAVRPLPAPARPAVVLRRIPPVVAAPALEIPRVVIPPVRPGAIARYAAGLAWHAERADSLASRMLAQHRALLAGRKVS